MEELPANIEFWGSNCDKSTADKGNILGNLNGLKVTVENSLSISCLDNGNRVYVYTESKCCVGVIVWYWYYHTITYFDSILLKFEFKKVQLFT